MGNDTGRAELLKGLNEDLAHEYAAMLSYLLYSRLASGPQRPELSAYFEGEVADELEHAKYLAGKIVALGGTPTTEPAEVRLADDNRGLLVAALEAERETLARYARRVEQADAAGEVGLRVELEDLIAEETRHKEELERILHGWPA